MGASEGKEVGERGSGLAYRKLVDGGMIYDREQKLVHHLNCTGASVWEGWQEGHSTEKIVQDLCLRYKVDLEVARVDVEQILAAFAASRLIEL